MGRLLKSKQVKILEAIGRYKFLTRFQLARLGIEKYAPNFSKYCAPLKESKLIGAIPSKMVNTGETYYLKSKGAKVLAEHLGADLESIDYVKSEPNVSYERLMHTIYAIDCQIELHLSCERFGIEIDVYDRDIDFLGSTSERNLQRKTRIGLGGNKYFEPDALIRICFPGKKRMYALELENKSNTAKSLLKIKNYVKLLNDKTIGKKYDHSRDGTYVGNRVLFVFTDRGMMEAVIKKTLEIVENPGNWFLFKHIDAMKTVVTKEKSKFEVGEEKLFFENWHNASSQIVDMV